MAANLSALPIAPAASFETRAAHWYALYTVTRHEKVVARQLEERRVETFLPLYRCWRRWKDRRKAVESPLFPSYVFVRIAPQERIRVLQVPGAVHFVGFQGKLAPLPEHEIDSLRRGLEDQAHAEPHPYLRIGRLVRVKRGPLCGVEGILSRKNERSRIVISIDAIMRSVAVEIDVTDIEVC